MQVGDGKVDLSTVSKQYKADEVLPARIAAVSGMIRSHGRGATCLCHPAADDASHLLASESGC